MKSKDDDKSDTEYKELIKLILEFWHIRSLK
jgi:hypothetical protein